MYIYIYVCIYIYVKILKLGMVDPIPLLTVYSVYFTLMATVKGKMVIMRFGGFLDVQTAIFLADFLLINPLMDFSAQPLSRQRLPTGNLT